MFSWSYIQQRPLLHCSETGLVNSFYRCGFTYTSLNLMLLLGMIHYSFRGTLINEKPRLNVSRILSAKVAVDIAGLLLAIQSTRWAFSEV